MQMQLLINQILKACLYYSSIITEVSLKFLNVWVCQPTKDFSTNLIQIAWLKRHQRTKRKLCYCSRKTKPIKKYIAGFAIPETHLSQTLP